MGVVMALVQDNDWVPAEVRRKCIIADAAYSKAMKRAGHLSHADIDATIATLARSQNKYTELEKDLCHAAREHEAEVGLELTRLRAIRIELGHGPIDDSEPSGLWSDHRLIKHAARNHGLSVTRMKIRRRFKHLVRARGEAYFLLKKHRDMSLMEIGEMFGYDHTTILNGIRLHEKRMREAAE